MRIEAPIPFYFFYFLLLKCLGSAVEVPWKCCDIFESTTKEHKMPLRYKEKYKAINSRTLRIKKSAIPKILSIWARSTRNILRKYNNSREWNKIVAFIYILYQWTIECKHLHGFIKMLIYTKWTTCGSVQNCCWKYLIAVA